MTDDLASLCAPIDPSDFYGIADAIAQALREAQDDPPDEAILSPKAHRRLRMALTAALAAPAAADGEPAASQGFTASNGEYRNAFYGGAFDGETESEAQLRRHWATAVQEHIAGAAPSAVAPQWPLIRLGFGNVEVGEGHHEGAVALIFGRHGTGTIGEATQPNREHKPGETLAVVTFQNVEAVDVVIGKLNIIRGRLAPGATPGGQEGEAA